MTEPKSPPDFQDEASSSGFRVGFAWETPLRRFLIESLRIEGIERMPTSEEIAATEAFLALSEITLADVITLQGVYAPGQPVRDRLGMNVRVGRYYPKPGGADIPTELVKLCKRVSRLGSDPWHEHVRFEKLHPFMDGNGRTGRAIWAWHMANTGQDPFSLPFLHRFYYQTLAGTR